MNPSSSAATTVVEPGSLFGYETIVINPIDFFSIAMIIK